MEQLKPSFTSLPDLVLHQIFEQLNPASLCALRLTCITAACISERFFYREIAFRDSRVVYYPSTSLHRNLHAPNNNLRRHDLPDAQSMNFTIAKHLIDKRMSLSRQVRHLTIGPFKHGLPQFLKDGLLISIIRNFSRLLSFRCVRCLLLFRIEVTKHFADGTSGAKSQKMFSMSCQLNGQRLNSTLQTWSDYLTWSDIITTN
jgi:hypothetical protein